MTYIADAKNTKLPTDKDYAGLAIPAELRALKVELIAQLAALVTKIDQIVPTRHAQIEQFQLKATQQIAAGRAAIIDSTIKSHTNLTNNPHGLTAAQVGLEKVVNGATVSALNAVTNSGDKYVTSSVIRELYLKYTAASSALNTNTSNQTAAYSATAVQRVQAQSITSAYLAMRAKYNLVPVLRFGTFFGPQSPSYNTSGTWNDASFYATGAPIRIPPTGVPAGKAANGAAIGFLMSYSSKTSDYCHDFIKNYASGDSLWGGMPTDTSFAGMQKCPTVRYYTNGSSYVNWINPGYVYMAYTNTKSTFGTREGIATARDTRLQLGVELVPTTKLYTA